jgi:hypothetical protein
MLGKAALLEAVAGTNRGILSSPANQQSILAAVAQLEDRNPTPNPLSATEKLNGNWRLLYTTSQELLRIDQVPFLKLGQIYQCIQVNTSTLYNIAEVYGLPYLEGIVSVVARFEAVSERRVNVRFERSIIGLQRLLNYSSATSFIEQIEAGKKFPAVDFSITAREQRGWLEITYLDDDLRIGRGNEGNVFVLTKL